MSNVRNSQLPAQHQHAPNAAMLFERALTSLRRSAALKGADLEGLPRCPQGRYLVVWPGVPGRRNQLVLRAEGPVEAAARFAVGLSDTTPRFFGRTGLVLYAELGEKPYAMRYYVIAASRPEARLVSSYLRRACDLHPAMHGGFLARATSPFTHTAKTCVVERRAALKIRGRFHTWEQVRVTPALSDGVAAHVAEILNADLKMGEEVTA